MKILVTGANGYIGSKIVTKLLDMGHIVIATDIFSTRIDTRAVIKVANILEDKKEWFEYFEKPEVCLHMAWRDGFIHNSINHMLDLSKHFAFLQKMIDSGLKHVSIMGSMHEVGYWEGAINENTPCNPQTYYGIAKNSLRQSMELLCKIKNVTFQWLRGFYIYGDDLHGNSIFCKIRKSAKNGEKKFPFTTGKNEFDFISIDDLTLQIACCITQNKINGIINVCSGKPTSLGKQVEWYIKKNELDITLDYGKFEERSTESPCLFGDNTKINLIMKNKIKKILITGSNGQLGYDCLRELKERGYINVKGIDINNLDITNKEDVLKFIEYYKPDIVMHNAAWTQVDNAEKMPEKVYDVNVLGTQYISEGCKKVGAKMVYISTDYVFDGKGSKEFEIDSPKNGLSVYGKTKSLGEEYVKKILDQYFIVRISGAFGKNGNNFVKTMLKLADNGKNEIDVVCDQIGSVTYTHDLAILLCDMIETEKYGIYHATNEGFISWAEFAEEIFKLSNKNVKINHITTEEYRKRVPFQANRPLNSRLSKKSLDDAGFTRLPDWKDALKRYLKEIE